MSGHARPAGPGPSPQRTLAGALDRLSRSRAALWGSCADPLEGDESAQDDRPRASGRRGPRDRDAASSGPVDSLLLALAPCLAFARRSLRRWWRRQPWQPAAEAAGEAARHAIVPWVRTHPLAAIGLGAAAGALLVAAAPWRWASVRTLAAEAREQGWRWTLQQLASPAAQALLLGVLASMTAAAQAGPRADRSPGARATATDSWPGADVGTDEGTDAGTDAGADTGTPSGARSNARPGSNMGAGDDAGHRVGHGADARAGTRVHADERIDGGTETVRQPPATATAHGP